MSDDLVKRLHSLHKQATVERSHFYVGWCAKDAIDRIEELEAKLRKSALQELSALGQASEAYQAQLAAEAKLARAMEALEGVRAFVWDLEPYADQGHTLVPALEKACTILAELKGQGDE